MNATAYAHSLFGNATQVGTMFYREGFMFRVYEPGWNPSDLPATWVQSLGIEEAALKTVNWSFAAKSILLLNLLLFSTFCDFQK